MEFFSQLLLPSIPLLILLISALFLISSCRRRQPPAPKKAYAGMLDLTTHLLLSSPTGTITIPPNSVFTTDPSIVEHMTKSNFSNFVKGPNFTSILHDFLGRGIFNSNGESWKVQRKTASYEFNAKSLRAFILDKVNFELDSRLIPLLHDVGRNGAVIDLEHALERFAFDNVCSLVFNQDPDCLLGKNEAGDKFFRAFEEASHLSIDRANESWPVVWKIKRLLNVGSEKRLKNAMAIVHQFIQGLIESRKGGLDGKSADFLSRFLSSEDDYSDQFIRDILISFVLAGRDTTPSGLTWFFWVVSSRKDVVDKILEEIGSVRARSEDNLPAFTLEEVREMNYLHAAVTESMRLYPPVSLLPRECVRDDTLPDGTKVKKGWPIYYSNYAMGRTKKIWGEDCLEFRPERWLDEEGVFRPGNVFEYPVFNAGPRLCLGKDMAYLQMKALAARVLEEFEVEVAAERGASELGITLKMQGGLPVRVKRRKRNKI